VLTNFAAWTPRIKVLKVLSIHSLSSTISINKNETQCGYDNPTVELSQTMDKFQQQQTGRLL